MRNHDAVEEVLLLPLLLNAQVGAVHTGKHGGGGAQEAQHGDEAALGELPLGEARDRGARVGAAGHDEHDDEGDRHDGDADGNGLLDLAVHALQEVAQEDEHHDYGRAYLPIDAEDEAHARADAGNVADVKADAGEEGDETHERRGGVAVVLADGVDGGLAGCHAQTIGN